MEEIIHADIFFFVTTAVLVIFGIIGLVVGIFLIIAVKNIKDLTKTLKEGGEKLVADVTEDTSVIRKGVKKYGRTAGKFATIVFGEYIKRQVNDKVQKKKQKEKKDGEENTVE